MVGQITGKMFDQSIEKDCVSDLSGPASCRIGPVRQLAGPENAVIQNLAAETGTKGRGKRRAKEEDRDQVLSTANVKLRLYFKHDKLSFSVSPNNRLLNSTMLSKSKNETQLQNGKQ